MTVAPVGGLAEGPSSGEPFATQVVQSMSSYYIAPAYGQMFFFILFLLVMIFRHTGLLGQKGTANIGIND